MYFLIFPPSLHLQIPFFGVSLTNSLVGVADAPLVMMNTDLHYLLLLSLQWAQSWFFKLAFLHDSQ
jgi:hypothetical protein